VPKPTLPLAKRIAADIAEDIRERGEVDQAWIADWIEQEAIIDLLEALKALHNEVIGLTAYLETCDPEVIADNLDSIVASARSKASSTEVAILKTGGTV
jgi:hypothetical protein